MKQTIEDYIRQNENFRQVLLKQDGGIMKYLAECLSNHPDTYADNEFIKKYREQYYDDFLKDNRGNYDVTFLEEDTKKKKAFGYDHLSKELSYQIALEPILPLIPEEVAEGINGLICKYMEFAWKENRRLYYPDGTPPDAFYKEVINLYSCGGIASICMDYLLREHHRPQIWAKKKNEYALYNEFLIRRYSDFIFKDGAYQKLRLAVKEITNGITPKECHQIAINTMMSVRKFSQMLYSTSEVRIADCTGSYKADKEWLRKVARWSVLRLNNPKVPFLHSCFSSFVLMLNEIGRIWAARLLVCGIDMHELEKETGCILFPVSEPSEWPDGLDHGNYRYYVDKDNYTLDVGYCIGNEKEAIEMLKKIKHRSYPPKELLDDKIKPYWEKLREKGFIAADSFRLEENVSPYDATYIAEHISGKLNLKNKWKVFEPLWGLHNMAQKLGDIRKGTATPHHQKEINEIFDVKPKRLKKLS